MLVIGKCPLMSFCYSRLVSRAIRGLLWHEFCLARKLLTADSSIDVKQMRVVSLPGNARYLALSYVWGRSPFIQLTKSNTELLKRKGSLQEHRLPRTLEDAINLVSLLDERYLWVDALCIVQDDTVSKMEQIAQMDRIYLCAALTIVSAGGIDANSGLSGFAPGSRRSEQTIELIGGVRFVVMSPPLLKLLDRYVYSSVLLSHMYILEPLASADSGHQCPLFQPGEKR